MIPFSQAHNAFNAAVAKAADSITLAAALADLEAATRVRIRTLHELETAKQREEDR